jgi:GST-like protein
LTVPKSKRITLYGAPGCGSAVVEAMLELGGLDYKYVKALDWQPYKRHRDLEKLNPLGQVPVLVLADGTVMTESAAMVMYLAERIEGMLPTESAQRAGFYRWMMFIPANIYSVFAFRDFPQRWLEDESAQSAFRDKLTGRLREYWTILEANLVCAPYALGKNMTALDVYLAMVSRWTPGRKWLAVHCPRVTKSVKKTEKHPIIASVWERNFGA